MRPIGFSLVMFLVLGLGSGCMPKGPKGRLTVHITNDDGQPVSEATVAFVGGGTREEGKTDRNGIYAAVFHNVAGEVDIVVEKERFYSINRRTYIFTGQTNDLFLPLNPMVELQLHKIGKPVPMVVKRVDEEMPVLGQPVGYDLLKSDWVKPYGRGETSDFIFEAKRWSHGTNDVNGWLRLTFPNSKDGLVPVRFFWRDDYELRLPATAPEVGYHSKVWWAVGEGEQPPGEGWLSETNMDQDANYYFRVRSHFGTIGEPIEAHYGKIYKGISLGLWNYRTNVTVNFVYYLNPDGTRNTEFDTRSNLCPNPGDAGGKP